MVTILEKVKKDYEDYLEKVRPKSIGSYMGVFSILDRIGLTNRIVLSTGKTDPEQCKFLQARICANEGLTANQKVYIRKFLEWLCDWYRVDLLLVPTAFPPEPREVMERRVEGTRRKCDLPKQIGNHNGAPESQVENVLYGYDVKEKDKIPGMISFLYREIELICASFAETKIFDDLNDYGHALRKIPIIVRSNTPAKECWDKDPWKVIENIKKQECLPPKDYKKRVTELVDQCHSFMPLAGLYHSDGAKSLPEKDKLKPYCSREEKFPYIEIFYRNIPEKDEDRFTAGLAATLSHELFHFLHDQLIGSKWFNEASEYREPVIESSADFFSVFHLVRSKSIAGRLQCAYERYGEWEKHAAYGSLWPYAYALYYFRVRGKAIPFLDDAVDFQRHRCISKLQLVVFASECGMDFAFEKLIRF